MTRLAVVHGALRQLRRGGGRGARQGAGRHAAQDAQGDDGAPPASASAATRRAVPASTLRKGDLVVVEAGELIPGDGEVVEGIASVDESAITGESAPVIRESGGDRSAVTGGTKVLSDRIVVRIAANPGESFLDRMIALVEGASRQKTPNEIALHILLVGLTLVFLFACVTLVPLALYSGVALSATVIVALLVCLIPTTIGGLLSAIGIAGMDRLLRKNVIAMSGRAVEAAGDVDTLLLDKTGTITHRQPHGDRAHPAAAACALEELADAAQLASLADETPEGRSIVVLVEGEATTCAAATSPSSARTFVPFTRADAHERLRSSTGARIRKGAVDAVATHVAGAGRRRARRAATQIADAHRRRGRHAAGGRRRQRACSASSTSRTSSRAASPSASRASAPWASAR